MFFGTGRIVLKIVKFFFGTVKIFRVKLKLFSGLLNLFLVQLKNFFGWLKLFFVKIKNVLCDSYLDCYNCFSENKNYFWDSLNCFVFFGQSKLVSS